MNHISMQARQIIELKYFRVVAIACGILLVILLSFAGGVKVGFHKALFSSQWGQNYERNFLGGSGEKGDRFQAPWGRMMGRGMRNAHGIAGEILSITDTTLVIKDRDNQENTIRINEGTIINQGRETLEIGSLAVGERIIVVGKPQEDGVIAAHLIRVFSDDSAL